MDDGSFDLLLNDDEYLERIVSGEFVVVDATMSSEQVRRLAERLLELREGDVVHPTRVLGLCPHGVDLDRDFCERGCRR